MMQRIVNAISTRRAVGIATPGMAAATTGAATAAPPPPGSAEQQEPPLLLEGDEFCVSLGGVARSFYELVPSETGEAPPIALEELYNLNTAHKTFHLRQEIPGYAEQQRLLHLPHLLHRQPADQSKGGRAPLGPKLASLELQEIDHGVDDYGTGSTTWESSICMALYFSTHPEQVRGNVLELGSGCGLGGILSNLGPRLNESYDGNSVKSITLTDANDEVLRQCKQNVQQAFGMMPSHPSINVSKLNWDDFSAGNRLGCYHERYNTVIACDCAYKVEDVASLSNALKALVHEDPNSKIHIFGPHNRSAFQEVIRYLSEKLDMDVKLELVEVNRFRLKPGTCHFSWHHIRQRYATEQECAYASKAVARFIHVVASHKPKADPHFQQDISGLD